MQLTNSDVTNNQDDFNTLDQFESGVPSFQAHFTVSPSPTAKSNEQARCKLNSIFFVFINKSIDSARFHYPHHFFHGLYNNHQLALNKKGNR